MLNISYKASVMSSVAFKFGYNKVQTCQEEAVKVFISGRDVATSEKVDEDIKGRSTGEKEEERFLLF